MDSPTLRLHIRVPRPRPPSWKEQHSTSSVSLTDSLQDTGLRENCSDARQDVQIEALENDWVNNKGMVARSRRPHTAHERDEDVVHVGCSRTARHAICAALTASTYRNQKRSQTEGSLHRQSPEKHTLSAAHP